MIPMYDAELKLKVVKFAKKAVIDKPRESRKLTRSLGEPPLHVGLNQKEIFLEQF